MPHFRLMDPDQMDSAEVMFFRAKLHGRGGKRRILEDKIPAGIAALHDAFLSSIQRYFLAPDLRNLLIVENFAIDLYDEEILFPILKKSGIINDSFTEEDFDYLAVILDEALNRNLNSFDQEMYYTKFDNVMAQLGILPFSEDELPSEDPSTY
jgi:hypothetical protein